MNRPLVAAGCALTVLLGLPPGLAAARQAITLKDFPQTFGTYAQGGDCARLPRVTIAVSGITLQTATGPAAYTRPDVALGFGGREDHSTTFFLQGPGEGLILSAEDGALSSSGGDHMGAAERAVDVAARNGMRRCGTPAPRPVAPSVAPAPPKMRAKAATSVEELARLGVDADPGFQAAYLRALGTLKSQAWLIAMDGPGDQAPLTVAGVRYLRVTTCKDRDCADNAMLALYRPDTGALYGIVSVGRRKGLLGAPPPAMLPVLMQQWKAAWPAS